MLVFHILNTNYGYYRFYRQSELSKKCHKSSTKVIDVSRDMYLCIFLLDMILYLNSVTNEQSFSFANKVNSKLDFCCWLNFSIAKKKWEERAVLGLLTYSLWVISKCRLSLLGFMISAAKRFEQIKGSSQFISVFVISNV